MFFIFLGEMIGTFQFGGSTYLLLFEKGLNIKFDAEDIPEDKWSTTLQKVNSSLGHRIIKRYWKICASVVKNIFHQNKKISKSSLKKK